MPTWFEASVYYWRKRQNSATALEDYLRLVVAFQSLLSSAHAHSERCPFANVGKTAAKIGARIALEAALCADCALEFDVAY